MNKINQKTKQNRTLKGLKYQNLILAFAIPALLTGCASMNQKEESIEDVLAKENTLIGKVQAERALPEVQQGVSQSENLKGPETHLSQALAELLQANEAIMTKVLKEQKEEMNDVRFGRGF